MDKSYYARIEKRLDESWRRYVQYMQDAGIVCARHNCCVDWKRSATGDFIVDLDFSQWTVKEHLMAREYDYYDGMFTCAGLLGLYVSRDSDGKHYISRS